MRHGPPLQKTRNTPGSSQGAEGLLSGGAGLRRALGWPSHGALEAGSFMLLAASSTGARNCVTSLTARCLGGWPSGAWRGARMAGGARAALRRRWRHAARRRARLAGGPRRRALVACPHRGARHGSGLARLRIGARERRAPAPGLSHATGSGACARSVRLARRLRLAHHCIAPAGRGRGVWEVPRGGGALGKRVRQAARARFAQCVTWCNSQLCGFRFFPALLFRLAPHQVSTFPLHVLGHLNTMAALASRVQASMAGAAPAKVRRGATARGLRGPPTALARGARLTSPLAPRRPS